jgi:hypothetical protein
MARLMLISTAVLIAAAILFSGRYQIVAGSESGIFRLDRMTGSVQMCLPKKDHPFHLDCSGEVDDWIAVPKR